MLFMVEGRLTLRVADPGLARRMDPTGLCDAEGYCWCAPTPFPLPCPSPPCKCQGRHQPRPLVPALP